MGRGHSQESPPPPAPEPLLTQHWRDVSFEASKREEMIQKLRNLKISNPKVQHLHILLHGPVGSGKSSFISSIESVFRGRMAQGAIADAMGAGASFTKKFHIKKFRDGKSGNFLPFVISDIMGLENTNVGGAHSDDVIMALRGHLKDGHTFNPVGPLQEGDKFYNSSPTLNDKVHCLVSVLPADKIGIMDGKEVYAVIAKLREIREKASHLKIPQVVLMTMVDNTCPQVKEDLKMIYRSKRIKEKMHQCTNKLGVTLNYVYPVKNYDKEIKLHNDVDILLLSALTNIVNFANDHVEEMLDG